VVKSGLRIMPMLRVLHLRLDCLWNVDIKTRRRTQTCY
jgi:hypothetical protein